MRFILEPEEEESELGGGDGGRVVVYWREVGSDGLTI